MDTVQSSPQNELFQDKATMSSPHPRQAPQCLRENSRVSEYLGQHGTLDLSGVTRPTLSALLARTRKHM